MESFIFAWVLGEDVLFVLHNTEEEAIKCIRKQNNPTCLKFLKNKPKKYNKNLSNCPDDIKSKILSQLFHDELGLNVEIVLLPETINN